MYQLNDEDFKTKNKTGKRVIIFLVVFTLIAALSTYLLIYFTNKAISEDNNTSQENNIIQKEDDDIIDNTPNKKVNEDNLKVKSLSETYNLNPIKINEVEVDTKNNKLKLIYDTIDGLKDKTIQENINNQIREKSTEIFNKYKADKTVGNLQVDAIVTASFADVISVNISYYIYTTKKESIFNSETLNFRLENGNTFKFEELFTNDATINSIIVDNAYKELAWQKAKDLHTNLDMDKVDLSEFEDDTLKMVNLYKQDVVKKFYFTPQQIFLYINGIDYAIPIEMADIYDSIAIYKRFKTSKDIYENPNMQTQKRLVFVKNNLRLINDSFYDFYDNSGDNIFVIANLNTGNSKEEQNIKSQITEKFKQDIETYKSGVNKSDGAVIRAFGNIYYDEKTKLVTLNAMYYIDTMSLDYYKNNIYELISKYERKPKATIEESLDKNNKNFKNKEYIKEYVFNLKGNIVK